MKKLILAAAIAATTAGAANAATVYEGNGLTYKLKGDFQIQLRKDAGDDQDTDIEFDDLELKNSVIYDLGNDMKAFGQVDFSFNSAADDSDEDSAKVEEAYLGLQFGDAAVSVGKQDLAVDDFGIENQYEETEDQSQFAETGADNVVRFDYAADTFSVAASTIVKAESEGDDVEGFDVLVATSVADVELAVAYQDYDDNAGTDYDAWGVSAAFDAGFAAFGADYSSADKGADTDKTYGLVAIVPVAETTDVSVGYTSTDNDSAEDVAEWYANVTYKFPTQKNVKVFAEIADTDADDVDLGYLVGMQVKF